MMPVDELPRPDLPASEAPGAPGPRQTLAMRLAARNGQRELRAARLARLRAGPCAAQATPQASPHTTPQTSPQTGRQTGPQATGVPTPPAPSPLPPAGGEAASFLELYLRGLGGPPETAPEAALEAPETVPETAPEAVAAPVAGAPGEILAFPPAPEAGGDLGRLPGVGPGLMQALRRAGLARLADLARLEPEALAARLGPIGRLVPARAWIAAARAAAEPVPGTSAEPAPVAPQEAAQGR